MAGLTMTVEQMRTIPNLHPLGSPENLAVQAPSFERELDAQTNSLYLFGGLQPPGILTVMTPPVKASAAVFARTRKDIGIHAGPFAGAIHHPPMPETLHAACSP